MNGRWMLLVGLLVAFSTGMAATAYSVDGGQETTTTVPRYSETCPHGHNGFDCKAPSHADDIVVLEKRIDDLEKDVDLLKRR